MIFLFLLIWLVVGVIATSALIKWGSKLSSSFRSENRNLGSPMFLFLSLIWPIAFLAGMIYAISTIDSDFAWFEKFRDWLLK